MTEQQSSLMNVVIVTGLSGAGKSTALKVYEDLGFFIVDGLPTELAPKLLELFITQESSQYRGIVLGMDVRQRDFLERWRGAVEEMTRMGASPHIVFIESKPEILVRRYATTRRPHPLEGGGLSLGGAIAEEMKLLAPVRSEAHLVIDSSDYSVHDLRRKLQSSWTVLDTGQTDMRLHLVTFGFKYGVPTEADLVFDLRFLPNPFHDEALRPLTGQDEPVANYVLAEDPGKTFINKFIDFLQYLVPLFHQEGRYRLTVAIGCTGGRHRSVSVAEALKRAFQDGEYAISLEHRHLELG